MCRVNRTAEITMSIGSERMNVTEVTKNKRPIYERRIALTSCLLLDINDNPVADFIDSAVRFDSCDIDDSEVETDPTSSVT
jgi:hypothetical protein